MTETAANDHQSSTATSKTLITAMLCMKKQGNFKCYFSSYEGMAQTIKRICAVQGFSRRLLQY